MEATPAQPPTAPLQPTQFPQPQTQPQARTPFPWKTLLASILILSGVIFWASKNYWYFQRSFKRHPSADAVETIPATVPLTTNANTSQAIVLGNTTFSQSYASQPQLLTLQFQDYAMLPSEVYQSQLVGLYADFNPLKTIVLDFANPPLLEVLTLSFTELEQLPPTIGTLRNLITLHLHFNQLQTLPTEIGQLSKLAELRLENNQLLELPQTIGGWTSLKTLDLSGNTISFLPPSIGSLQSLEKLNLSGNQLSVLPQEISLLTNLQELGLKGNQLTSLPTEIAQLQNLRMLDISENNFTFLPPQLSQLSQLQYLYLGGNQFSPEQIDQLKEQLPNTLVMVQ